MIKKLYKDGSTLRFKKYFSAVSIAIALGGIFFTFWLYFFRGLISSQALLGHLFQEHPNAYLIAAVMLTLISIIAMLYILVKPLFIIKNNKLFIYDGLIWRNSYHLDEITSIQICSDESSLSLDVKTNSATGKTFDMKSVGTMGMHIKNFLEANTLIEVKYLDLE